MYSKAADIGKFFKGMVTQREVKRTKTGQTVVRVNIGNQGSLKTAFFVLDHVRDVPSDDKRIEENAELEQSDVSQDSSSSQAMMGGGKVSEDIKMTRKVFDIIVSSATEIPEGTDRNLTEPITGQYVNVLEMVGGKKNNKTRKIVRTNKKTRHGKRKSNSKKTRKH
jgi:hypothetical protein